MKKKTVCALLMIALLCAFMGSGCSVGSPKDTSTTDSKLPSQNFDNQTINNQPTEAHFCSNKSVENQIPDERIPQNRRRPPVENAFYVFCEQFKNTLVSQTADTELDIPLYYESDLIKNEYLLRSRFYLNYDASRFPNISSATNLAPMVLALYPTNALRIREDHSSYAVYDTETGCRVYVYIEAFEDHPDYPFLMGFPIVIRDMLCRTCFANIKVGDPIENVEAIDSVTTLYKESFQNSDPEEAKQNAEKGYPLASIHYLKDGILKINYTMQEDRSLIISELIFNKNYQLVDSLGRMIDYKIEDIDLPVS